MKLTDTQILENIERQEVSANGGSNAGLPHYDSLIPVGKSNGKVRARKNGRQAKRNHVLDDDDLLNIDIDDGVGLYLKQVASIPLLTREEEIDLAQKIELGGLAREELAKGQVSPARRQELSALIEAGSSAREHLITANSRLVISIAKKYMNRGVPFQDLIQAGNIGLLRTIKKFDHRRGLKFSTYATWWIRQAITRIVADQARTIRIPVHVHEQVNKLWRTRHQLTQKLERDPTLEELAAALDISTVRVESIIRSTRQSVSLETPIGHEGDRVLGDVIQDQESATPDDTAADNLLKEQIEKLFHDLPPREVLVLRMRFGLVDGQIYTLHEVGQKLGVSRERVRQIEARALRRLRHPKIRHQLEAYLR